MEDTASLAQDITTTTPSPQTATSIPTIRRIPKACGSCRYSKLRCDGQRPCARCGKLGKDCVYVTRPPDPVEERFERLETEILHLRDQVAYLQTQQKESSHTQGSYIPVNAAGGYGHVASGSPPLENASFSQVSPSINRNSATSTIFLPSEGRKRKRTQIELRQDSSSDFITKGLMSISQARGFWDSFFRGCDRFVPVFDPSYDTFESVRLRSSFLFNAICTVGCPVSGTDTQLPHALNFELKKQLNQVVITHETASLEAIQALLVIACYSPERSLVLSFATRLALDLYLPNAFNELTASLMATNPALQVDKAHLVRCSRTWFQLVVLENMLQVDAGKLPAFAAKGSAHRCRVLLQQPETTPLDLRLLSQVELNYLRTKIHDALEQQDGGSDDDILDEIRDARIDIDLWFSEWKAYMESSLIPVAERPMFLVNLRIQKHWCEAMFYFRALKCLGIENIDAMSPAGRQLLAMAKASLKAHLATTLEEPGYYLESIRFAMDFVWAKCAFCFLLVLKLTRLLPESDQDNYRLLEDGNKLYQQLSNAGTCPGSSNSRVYVQVLGMSLEKYGRALRQHQQSQSEQPTNTTCFWESSDANVELQSFVPEQFVFEWSFPGLTLFSSPTAWQEFFDGKANVYLNVSTYGTLKGSVGSVSDGSAFKTC
ncbi:putative c6 zinc finger domain protein [Eutypa lata UCREL1]|uniref:Putative c6 zinc finger domain protein n=1 Tax=Eutypa lata (strain UCR-EL1) TaxID=1287681 RepID=M7TL42_EUTLA|nr:putative c6 zinc finger domain protein [Eutypa lata UCREL1]